MSRAFDSATKPKKPDEQESETFGNLSSRIFHIKKQIQSARFASVNEKLKRNEKNLKVNTHQLLRLATSHKDHYFKEPNGSKNMLLFRIESPLCKLSGYAQGLGEKDNVNSQEVFPSTTIKLPFIEKIPPYTTWIFLDKNQRMAEDQSVVGRRQIYYDQYGGETLICSDSEEEIAPEEEKHEFSEGEDQMLWKAVQEHGITPEVLTILSQIIKATASEIQDRYKILMERYEEKHPKQVEGSGKTVSERDIFLDKSLNVALDSFDNLFCRRCLVFDCRLHGCSQSLIIPGEKQPYLCGPEENQKPCSEQCYLKARKGVEHISERSVVDAMCRIEIVEKDGILPSSKSEPSLGNVCTDIIPDERFSDGKRTADISPKVTVISKSAIGALTSDESILPIPSQENLGKRKVLKDVSITLGCSTLCSDKFQPSASKKLKKLSGSVAYVATEDQQNSGLVSSTNIMHPYVGSIDANEKKKPEHVSSELIGYACKKYVVSCTVDSEKKNDNAREHEANNNMHVSLLKQPSNSTERQVEGASSGCEWKLIEKELYLKGVEIFGKNSCLIARNLLSGLKTCKEVSAYMLQDGDAMLQKSSVLPNPGLEDNGKPDTDCMDQEMPTRSRIFRRRGRTRRLKYTWKSAGHPSSRKRIADGQNQPCKQYTPCGCKFMCGKQCSCHQYGTCCEKYCGCSKSCKNRFRGCHCAKSQCRSRQCPCFAAGRECDPDVCRNCWVSCGDGSLGEPPARGDGYQCGNMRLLLKQQQRILLSKSNVAGWGAFLKNPVNKNDYLGEYTGEIISHREADKRGKIYDRANSSFLFDLNDQSVLDAYRKGDKLKFANHSSNPNCCAKVMLVAGDHRVGIFAKERIEACEELFYDYRYGPDQAPIWARNPQASKRDDPSVSNGRARKHQSHL
ncbi:SANT/Myb domain [Macleaya cordata]|uniref:[histone H3]-lysine(27) N-trimethyltransferase n=1 Tax=Macleaya cordata TaxID=56857 RepID=A0A200R235_MACCD|nr:SANT/Myb domain [Macleaya cordata]